MSAPILEIIGLKTQFNTRRGILTAVDDVSFSLETGETLGVVGESGCGKSVTALSILQLLPRPMGKIAEGKIMFQGTDLAKAGLAAIRRIRGNDISMIFQEPMTSLNPVFTTGFQVMEPLRKHRGMTKSQAKKEAIKLLELVGIPEPASRIYDYPHQMSGGMRQRVMIAMALACRPKVMIADEPTTALDVTIQAQILELMKQLQREIGMTVLLITHDLGVVAETCQRVIVMYAGKIIEKAPVEELFSSPAHPYTNGLLNSLPKTGSHHALKPIPGTVPSMLQLPSGCAFQERCRFSDRKCLEDPPWIEIRQGHMVRCWRPMEHY